MIKIVKIQNNFDIRLDKFLKNKFTSLTQSFIEKNIRKKNILINNSKTSSKYIVKNQDIIKILNFNENSFKNKIIFKKKIVIPESILVRFKSSIVYENDNFIILNKWSSISTQGGSKINISIDDIINKLSNHYKLVHRLDKDTSGLLIISKNKKSAKIFGEQFKLKKISKTYLAICEGRPKLKESMVNLDIKNKLNKVGKTQTFYSLLHNYLNFSLILFKPMTGKTHQLRIVSKNISCPIVGDKKYNINSKFNKEILKLNAHILKFSFDDKIYEFISELPKDFTYFLKSKKLKYSKNSTKF